MDPIFGEDGCKITDVCETLETLNSYKIVIEKLNEIGLRLGVAPDQLHRIKTGLTLSTTTPFEALNDILGAWKAKYSDNARLDVFLDILRRCGIGDVADALKRRFNIEENHGHKSYVSPPEGVLDFLSSNQKVLVIRTRDKNVTASKLKDTTTCIHTADRHKLANNLQNGKVCSFECNDDFNLIDALNFIPAESKYKIIIITDEGLTDVEKTCAKFTEVILAEDNIKWSQLSPSYQINMTEKNVKISGRRLTLKEFTRTIGRLEDGMLDEAALLDIINNKEPHLDKSTLPDLIPYYIPRRISPRSFLNSESIFKTNLEKDIFMFSGIDAHELSKYTKSKITDSSTNQRRMAKPTVAHMVLDMASDFDEISKKHEGPTHWIMHDKGKFSFARSSGRIDKIRNAIEHKRAQPEYTQEQFLNFIKSNSGIKTPVVISDTPGMGKTQLLGYLAKQLISRGEIVLFGVLPRVLKALKAKIQEGLEMQEAVLEVVSNLGEQSTHVEKFLRNMIENDEEHVNVMLDGFDEISSGDFKLAKEVLQTINSFLQVRLWVTTRPNYLETLEDWLQVLGHNIQAFNPKDQLNCLVQYWIQLCLSKIHGNKLVLESRLNEFAEACLDRLHKCMRDKDHDIAGVPLQCMLIGEVFSQEALNYATPENVQSAQLPPSISIRSITDLYTRLIEKKLDTFFERYPSSNHTRDQLKLAHMLMSIKLLFPEWEDTMKKLMKMESYVEVDIQTILNVGLLEKVGSDGKASFIHRTIAEYFTADFVVNRRSRRSKENSASEFLGQVLESKECETSLETEFFPFTKVKGKITSFMFEHKEVVYFIDNLIQPDCTPILCNSYDKVEILAHSCVTGNFVNLFHHFDSAKLFQENMHRLLDNQLVFSSIRHSDLSIIQKVCEMFDNTGGGRLPDIEIPLAIPGLENKTIEITLLHIAVKYRERSVVQFLINSHGFLKRLTTNHSSVKDVVSFCVEGSLYDDISLIGEKVLTLRVLHGINTQLVQYSPTENEELFPPLLCSDVHVSLLVELISLKANFRTELENDILANAASYLKPDDFHKLVDHIPPSDLLFLLRHQPIFYAYETTFVYLMQLEDFELLPQTILLFKKVGQDFNYVDNSGNSILDLAIMSHKSITTYQKLIECGAIVPSLNKRKWTLLHTALGANNFVAFQYFADKLIEDEFIRKQVLRNAEGWSGLKNLKMTKLGIDVNIKNSEGDTILHCLGKYHYNEMDETKLLLRWGADINARNKGDLTTLEENLDWGMDLSIEKLIFLESHGAIRNQRIARKVMELLVKRPADKPAISLAMKIRKEWKPHLSNMEFAIRKHAPGKCGIQ